MDSELIAERGDGVGQMLYNTPSGRAMDQGACQNECRSKNGAAYNWISEISAPGTCPPPPEPQHCPPGVLGGCPTPIPCGRGLHECRCYSLKSAEHITLKGTKDWAEPFGRWLFCTKKGRYHLHLITKGECFRLP